MSFLERQLADPASLARVKLCFYLSLAVIAGAEIILPRIFHGGEVHFSFERFPAWGSLYGFFSCVVIIVVSKFLGKMWLMRPEDYYGD